MSRTTAIIRSALVAGIAYVCISFGLVTLVPEVFSPILAGIICGLVAKRPYVAWVTTGVTVLVLGMLLPPWYLDVSWGLVGRLVVVVVFAAATGTVAALVSWIVTSQRHPERARLIGSIIALVLIVGTMWYTAIQVNQVAFGAESLNAQLDRVPQPGQIDSDDQAYLRMFYTTHDGLNYYDAVRETWANDTRWGDLPFGVMSYRLPTLFWAWLALPATGSALPLAFLALASVAIVAVYFTTRPYVGDGIALLGALPIATYLLFNATTLFVTYVDLWGMAVLLIGLALVAHYDAAEDLNKGSNVWLYSGIAVVVLAALTREILVYVVLIAILAWFANTKEHRIRNAAPWIVGFGVFVVGYALHVIVIDGQIAPDSSMSQWTKGGFDNLVASLGYSSSQFVGGVWSVTILVALGLTGAIVLWRTRRSSFGLMMGASVVAFLMLLLAAGNGGRSLETGLLIGYWGALVVPLALACVPLGIDAVTEFAEQRTRNSR